MSDHAPDCSAAEAQQQEEEFQMLTAIALIRAKRGTMTDFDFDLLLYHSGFTRQEIEGLMQSPTIQSQL